MSYEKQTWQSGDVITAAKMNHIEDGIAGGGSGGTFFINIEWDDSQANYVLKTPFQQIKEAYEAGKLIVADLGADGIGLLQGGYYEGLPGEEPQLEFYGQIPYYNDVQAPFVNVFFIGINEEGMICTNKAFYFKT